MKHWLADFLPSLSYVALAAGGGAARYLHSYTHGGKFSIGVFAASIILSGFSGLMFAFLGESMQMPVSVLYIFAGIGGFMGHSALEFLAEWIKTKVK